jgi:hypothetical protein
MVMKVDYGDRSTHPHDVELEAKLIVKAAREVGASRASAWQKSNT